jgi:hypothetical protein
MENKITLSALARAYGLDKHSVKSALSAAGLKWTLGPNRSHLFDATAARAVLESKRDVMSEIREQRLRGLTAQAELAEIRRDAFRKTHIPTKAHFFIMGHVAAAVHRWLYSLELPFPDEIRRGHDLTAEMLEASRAMGLPEESLESDRKELARARRALEKAIAEGLLHDRTTGEALHWMKVPTQVRMSLYVRREEELEIERETLAATNGNAK